MRFIDLHGTKGPENSQGQLDTVWVSAAQTLLNQLTAAPDKASRDAIIDANDAVWKQVRDWLLRLSHDKCWYSESKDLFSILEVEHYRPKKRCKRQPSGTLEDGYWWLSFDWNNYRMCGKVGNARKGDFFPLAQASPMASYGGLHYRNEIPLLLDPACAGDPDLVTFDEDGAFVSHSDADQFTKLRVETTAIRLNLNYGRVKQGRKRIWDRCWRLITECRSLVSQLNQAPGPADASLLRSKKEELRRMTQSDAEFSAVAKACLLKSNISWAQHIVGG